MADCRAMPLEQNAYIGIFHFRRCFGIMRDGLTARRTAAVAAYRFDVMR